MVRLAHSPFNCVCLLVNHAFCLACLGTVYLVPCGDALCYVNGKQVRDVLYCDDLVDLYLKAANHIEAVRGKAYNVGGGPHNTLSLLEFLAQIGDLTGTPVQPNFSDWRPGDQPVFVADIRAIEQDLGWKPKTSPQRGVESLWHWVQENQQLFRSAEQRPIIVLDRQHVFFTKTVLGIQRIADLF